MNEILYEERTSVGEYSAWAVFRNIRLSIHSSNTIISSWFVIFSQGQNVNVRHREAAFHIYRFLIEYAINRVQTKTKKIFNCRYCLILFLGDNTIRQHDRKYTKRSQEQ